MSAQAWGKPIQRTVEGRGRIVVPREFRSSHGVTKEAPVEIIGTDEGVYIKFLKDENEKGDNA